MEFAMRKSLAIISSYNEACGNASYTHVLAEEFAKHVDVDIIPLDLFLLQSRFPRVMRAAEKHIEEICAKVRHYDYVNIQFEMGLYGRDPMRAVKRVLKIIGVAKNVIVTMHRIDYEASPKLKSFVRSVFRLSPYPFLHSRYERKATDAYFYFLKHIKRLNMRKNVSIMVHTKRERRILKYVFGIDNAVDFPITFLNKEKRSSYLFSSAEKFKKKYNIESGKKIVGVFGFISAYKGFETAIRALDILPENYILFIFGSQHPQSIEKNVPIDPYIENILKDIDKTTSSYVGKMTKVNEGVVLELAPVIKPVQRQNIPLRDRIYFIGNVDDEDFIEALRCCDAVVLPYIETGQSMSGVAALTLEVKANSFFANNLSFMELRKYFGDSFYRFDIGNYVELAQKIMNSQPGKFDEKLDKAYEKYNIEENIKLHLEMFRKGERVQ